MQWLTKFLTSTIGMKVLMAVTGLIMFSFVLVHMLGNLQVFLGEHVYNHYAETLQGMPEIVWLARLGLLGTLLAHVVSVVILTARSKSARPTNYKQHKWLSGTYAVRTMRFGGVVLLAFIIFHLAQFTVAGVAVEGFRHCAWVGNEFTCYAYQNFVSGFQNPIVVGAYVVAQAALGLHLSHGAWSLMRTLGLNNAKYDKLVRDAATLFGVLVFLGNSSMPIAVIAGFIA
jgi:succinate dehydrogenase / fumarate reductase, cytochrome b subunit